MRTVAAIGLSLCVLGAATAHAAECPGNPYALGTSRVLTIDPTQYPRLGTIQYPETLPLDDKEVVLTFDDGPLPPYTNRVLEILAAECVKANYFLIGRMARGYPDLVKRIAAEGHTVGTHTHNHPLAFDKMNASEFRPEIEDGIAAVAAALGSRQSPAPFFRIPGLLRADGVEDYLRTRRLTAWSADLTGDDWKHISASEVVKRTISRLEETRRGIILLHDIQPATALALPNLLKELKARGYRVVQVKPAIQGLEVIAAKPAQPPIETAAARPTTPAPLASVAPPRAATLSPPESAPPRSDAAPARVQPAPILRVETGRPATHRVETVSARSYEQLARPFTARLKPYRSTEISAKPPFEPASGPIRATDDQVSMTRGTVVVTDIAVNAQASARQGVRQGAPSVYGPKATDPSGDLGMWPFEGLKQSAAR